LEIIIAVIAGYLWGGIPSAYLLARYRLGIDIRKYGTGNVGASNVITHVGRKSGFALGLFDGLAKGTGPVVAASLLGGSDWAMAAAGLAAVAGHNWSPYIKFMGGRGVSTSAGVFLGFLLLPELGMIILVAGIWGGIVRKNLAMWLLLTMVATPVMAISLDRSNEAVIMTLAVLGLLVAKRLAANWQRPLENEPLTRVLFYRLLVDRDIASKADWVSRRPDEPQGIVEA
jgi:glycerol-3-phosphate acyltransferase PlsY